MTKLDAPKNANYAATVVRIGTLVKLPGLDNLVGVPVLGYQALTQNDKVVGEFALAFTAETQLSEEYAKWGNLNRDETLNSDTSQKGYLESNRRIRALKLRGHVSNALLMPLESLAFAGDSWRTLREGDTFDTIDGHEICRKYVIPTKPGQHPAKTKLEKAFKRVDKAQFPEHLDTDNFWRNKHLLREGEQVVVTQKLHGTSFRIGNVPVKRELSRTERVLRWLGWRIETTEFDVVYGSRKVIKDVNNPKQQHFYGDDIWTTYGKRIRELIPEGYIVYGELIGWTESGEPLQKGYTYDLPQGEQELYVYRVATINRHGYMADLPWDGVKAFCTARGLKWAPELLRTTHDSDEGTSVFGLEHWVSALMDRRYHADWVESQGFTEMPVPLSALKSVDEGVCIRQEGLVPTLLKAKSPVFLEHETKLLDKGEADIESLEAA